MSAPPSTVFSPQAQLSAGGQTLRFAHPAEQAALVGAHMEALRKHALADLISKLDKLQPVMKEVSVNLDALGTEAIKTYLNLPSNWASKYEDSRSDIRTLASDIDDDAPGAIPFFDRFTEFATMAEVLDKNLKERSVALREEFPDLSSSVFTSVVTTSCLAKMIVAAGENYANVHKFYTRLQPFYAPNGNTAAAGQEVRVKVNTVANRNAVYRYLVRFCLSNVAVYKAALASCFQDVQSRASAAGEASLAARVGQAGQQPACVGKVTLSGAVGDQIEGFSSFSSTAILMAASMQNVLGTQDAAVMRAILSQVNRDSLELLIDVAINSWRSSKTIIDNSQSMPIASVRKLAQSRVDGPSEVATEMAGVAAAIPDVPVESDIIDRLRN